MVTGFTLKRYGSLLLMGFLPLMTLVGCSFVMTMLPAIIVSVLVAFVLLFICAFLLMNPFQAMLEKKGVLTLTLDSTGIINVFISRLSDGGRYLKGRIKGDDVSDVWDRASVFSMKYPVNTEGVAEELPGGGVRITLSEKELNESRFGFFHFPVLIYNPQLRTMLTKDWIAEREGEAFAEHGIFYLNRKMEDLTSHIRDFGRMIVDSLKEKGSLFKSPMFWGIIIGVGLLVIVVLFGPKILEAIKGPGSQVVSTIQGAPIGPIVPGGGS
jgi:hypothetical protein